MQSPLQLPTVLHQERYCSEADRQRDEKLHSFILNMVVDYGSNAGQVEGKVCFLPHFLSSFTFTSVSCSQWISSAALERVGSILC